MIYSTRQIYLLRLGKPAIPANLGGSSKSDSSVKTQNETLNNATSIDKRAVAQDSAVSLTGDGNTVNRNSTTNFADSSNRSTTSLTSFIDNSFKDSSSKTTFTDSSNRSTTFTDNSTSDSSTNFTDSSDRSVHTTVTDYGSVGAALDGMGAMVGRAFGTVDLGFGVAGDGIKGAVDTLKLQTTKGYEGVSDAFAVAKAMSASSQANSAAVLGFATDTIKKTNEAFAQADDGGQSKMVMAALVVVGAVGVAMALKD
jgi:hypothetical protein